jgi:hypothetical protein
MNHRDEEPRRETGVVRRSRGETAAKSPLRGLGNFQHIEPQPVRWAVVGVASVGVVGAISGLISGLYVYAPTAPFAMLELGLPAAMVGGVVGPLVGSLLAVIRRAA